jgi:hypothetical protein
MLVLVKAMGQRVTTHGFRSSFRDWAAERTNFPNEVIEMCRAFVLMGSGEARRGAGWAAVFKKVRAMMPPIGSKLRARAGCYGFTGCSAGARS